MEFKEFQKFIAEQSDVLDASYAPTNSMQEKTFARLAKIAEEFGELSGEVLASIGHQRKSKMAQYSPESLADEFADTIITTFLLAHTMKVDVPEALTRKIEKIKAKHNKELGAQ